VLMTNDQMDAKARAEGTYITLAPFMQGRSDFEAALLLYIAEREGVSAAVQLILAWEMEEDKWNQGQGVFQ
jgi:diketogulonate reductase-like aldo/keto reductase